MKTLCSFTVELSAEALDAERIEDIVYNCLDFCQLNERTPHFRVCANVSVSELWPTIELLHREDVSFSLLTEPEWSRVKAACSAPAGIRIDSSGSAYFEERSIGNVLEDRLADLWVTAGLEKGEAESV